MKKFFRRLFRFLLIILIIGIILGVAGTLIFRNQIGSRLVNAFNNQITSSFTYEAISLNLFNNFPQAKTELSGVLLEDINGDTLLAARSMTFQIGLFDLIQSKYNIENMKIEKATVQWKIDADGNPNYEIFKDETADNKRNIDINQTDITDLQLLFQNLQYDHSGLLDIKSMTLDGGYAGNELNLTTDAQLTSKYVNIQGQRFLEHEAIAFKAPLEINPTDEVFEFKNGTLLLNGNQFRINADIQSWENGNYMDVFINSEDSRLEGVLQLLPDTYTQRLGLVKSEQNINFSAWVKGILGRVERPEIKAELKLEDSQIEMPQINTIIDSASMMIVFKNGELRNMESAAFEVRNLQGYLAEEPIRLNAVVENLDNPNLHIAFDGKLPFELVYAYFQDEGFEVEKGAFTFDNFNLKGRYENMIDPSLITLVESSGKISIDSILLKSDTDSVSISQGVVDITGNKMIISDLQLAGFDSELALEAVLFNVLPVLLSDEENSMLSELEFDIAMDANRLHLSRMLSTLNLIEPALIDSIQQDSVPIDYALIQERREQLASFLKGNVAIEIDSLYFNELKASQVKGNAEIVNNDIQLNGSANVFGGKTVVESQINVDNQLRLEVLVDLQNVQAKAFLAQSNELYQQVIQAKNISGVLSSKVVINAFWDKEDQFIDKKFRARGIFDIRNGQFKDWPITTKLSDQLNVKALANLEFDNWQSYLEIRRGKVFLPLSIVEAKDLNLIASAEQQFEGKYRYNVQLNARSHLAKTLTDNNPSVTPIPSNTNNYYNFYYSIFGKNNKEFNLHENAEAIKADFERSKIRGREISQVLQQSFSNLKIFNYTPSWSDKPIIKEEIIIPEENKQGNLPKKSIEIKTPPIDSVKIDTTSQ